MIKKVIIAGVSVYVIVFLINIGLSEFYRSSIIDREKESVVVTTAFAVLGGVKTAVSEFYSTNGKLPENNQELGIGGPESLAERWIKSVTIGPSGRIDALLKGVGENAHIYLYAEQNPRKLVSSLVWRCYAKGIRPAALEPVYSPSCTVLANNENPPAAQGHDKKPTVEDLIKAIHAKRNGLIQILIKQQVDVNGRNAKGESPLRIAIEYSDNYSVQQLVSAGAKVNEVIADQNNKTLLMLATQDQDHGGLKIRELLRAGANIEERDATGKTPLIYAAINNNSEAARVLLEKGADINSFDQKGQTAKNYAALMHGKDSKVYRRLALQKQKEDDFIYRLPDD